MSTIRRILHIDMDAFFAAIEQRDNPDLVGKPVIVGADPTGRGVVSTCSYEARQYGVRSAMPIKEAFHRCPHGIFLRPNMKKYREVSYQLSGILSAYSPLMELVSVDEAFLDLTGTEKILGASVTIAQSIKSKIKSELSLTASVGIGPNKLVAKIASDLKKPDGLVIVEYPDVENFLAPLPVRKIWGVGPKASDRLKSLGINTIEELRKLDAPTLTGLFGSFGPRLFNMARGEDDTPVVTESQAKSVGREKTFHQDVKDRKVLEDTLLALAQEVGWNLRRQHLKGRTVQLKLRDADFVTITRQQKLSEALNQDLVIYHTARDLLLKNWTGRKIRLIGVSVTDFMCGATEQLELFSSPNPHKAIDAALDKIREKFGYRAVTRAKTLKNNLED